jgi:hypothetical protein
MQEKVSHISAVEPSLVAVDEIVDPAMSTTPSQPDSTGRSIVALAIHVVLYHVEKLETEMWLADLSISSLGEKEA